MKKQTNINPFFFSTDTPFFTHIVDGDDYISHSHLHYEIFYILSGTIEHILNGEQRTLHAGDMLFLCPSDTHNFIRPSDGRHRDIIFTENFLTSILASTGYPKSEFQKRANLKYFHLSNDTISVLEKLLKEHLSSYFHQEKSANLIGNTTLLLLFSDILFTQNPNGVNVKDTIPEWLTFVIERFNNLNLIQQGLPAILDGIHYNKTYLNRTFKKHFGLSLSEYLTSTRLNYAIYYLKNTKYSNEQISDLLGFSSSSYFYKLFKKQFNLSPNVYRKLYE